mgnify:CR=1 FL=1
MRRETLGITLEKIKCSDCRVPMVFEPNIMCTETRCTVEDLFRDRQGAKGDWVTLGYIDCMSKDSKACLDERLSNPFIGIVFQNVVTKVIEWVVKNGIKFIPSDEPLFMSDGAEPQLWFKLTRNSTTLNCHLRIDDMPEETETVDGTINYFEVSMVCQ